MGMESFGGFKPKLRQEEVPKQEETKIDTSRLAADVEKFAKTKDGKQAMRMRKEDGYYDNNEEFHYFEERPEVFEQNTEQFNAYIQERVEASRDKVNNILQRFRELSENKKTLLKAKMNELKGKIALTTSMIGMGVGSGSFIAANVVEGVGGGSLTTAALVGAVTALVAGIASINYSMGTRSETVMNRMKENVEQSQRDYTQSLEDVLSQAEEGEEENSVESISS